MRIITLQKALIALGFKPGKADGLRGKRTIAATKKFQRKYGLVPDGVAGSQTAAAIKSAMAKPTRSKAEPDKSGMQSTPLANDAKPGRARVKRISIKQTARFIKEIIQHCAATPEGKNFTVRDITSWHKQRGWNRCGYHYIIYRDGTIVEGCPIGQLGIHTRGHNKHTVGVSYIGGMDRGMKRAKDTRTAAQKASMIWLTKELASLHPVRKISGHREYSPKACPSFDVRKDALGNIPGFVNGIRKAA